MLRTTQLGVLRLIIQTTRKYQKQTETGEKDIRDDEISEETQEEISTHDESASQEDNLFKTGLNT